MHDVSYEEAQELLKTPISVKIQALGNPKNNSAIHGH